MQCRVTAAEIPIEKVQYAQEAPATRSTHDDPRFSDCERGNAHSHLRAALLGRSVAVGISGGELSLGRFQSILFAELDGPRPRSIDVQIMGV